MAIGSMLKIPLRDGDRIAGYLSVFRDEIETEKLWAGQVNLDRRQDLPRESFEAWKQTQMGQARSWAASGGTHATATTSLRSSQSQPFLDEVGKW